LTSIDNARRCSWFSERDPAETSMNPFAVADKLFRCDLAGNP
jgi:hypothetical protein